MKNELIIKKCFQCGAIVKIVENCNCEGCGLVCCGEEMQPMKANSIDAAIEKHVPVYEVVDDTIRVHVNHVMEEDHFIEWICFRSENREEYVYLNAGEDATAIFKNVSSGILYSYCNKHGLWSVKIGK